MRIRTALLLIASLWLGACANGRKPIQASVPTITNPGPSVYASHVQVALLLFGGDGHKTFLGCLNCPDYYNTSVLNEFGDFGSQFSANSIWNHSADFGSWYSQYSVCNRFATDAPVIVDKAGDYYGRLTVNENYREIGIGTRYLDWVKDEVCLFA